MMYAEPTMMTKMLNAAVASATSEVKVKPPAWPRIIQPYMVNDVTAPEFKEPLLQHQGNIDGRLGEWIWHNDRNAMMFGIENRSPFLDHRLVKFLGTGYQKKMVGQWNKHELRSLYDRLVPMPAQWRRQKQGFRWKGAWFVRDNEAKHY